MERANGGKRPKHRQAMANIKIQMSLDYFGDICHCEIISLHAQIYQFGVMICFHGLQLNVGVQLQYWFPIVYLPQRTKEFARQGKMM
jgi:hypothetical protein